MEACAECGYSYGSLGRAEIAPELRAQAGRYRDVLLEAEDGRLRAHPRQGVWSALEYGCHVRDVLTVQRGRTELARTEEQPEFAPMRREERVLEERYNAQDPATVAEQIVAGADALAGTFEGLDDAGWERTGIYNWPTTAARTVEWIGRHTVHECVHHLTDIGSLLSTPSTAVPGDTDR